MQFGSDEEFQLTDEDAAAYGDVVGDLYDTLYPGDGLETEAAVRMLAALAGERPGNAVLEFGIGTGRLGLGLHRLGVHVAGIEGSERMVAQLRSKPEGDALEVAVGDYRTTRIDRVFSTVALVFNNIFDPRGRKAQLDIFRNAAHHLEARGCFVVEAFVLSDEQRSGDWSVSPRYVGHEHVEIQLARYHIDTNQIERTLVHLRSGQLDFITVSDTYAAPGELDLMAEVTGFRLLARWAGWSGEIFTAASRRHVSVYELIDQR